MHTGNTVKQVLEAFRVYDCPEFTKVRVGNANDGGYVVLRELCEKTPNVYTFGVGDDMGFELDFIKRFPRATVLLHDPTIERLPQEHSKFMFVKEGVSDNLDASIPKNSLLKMDVEWAEWDALLSLDGAVLERFSQIVVEFHMVQAEPQDHLSPYFKSLYRNVFKQINENLFGLYCGVLKKLNLGFFLFHLHANNSLPRIAAGGFLFPPLLEASFVRRNLVRTAVRTESKFPVPGLDSPNKTDRRDAIDFYPLTKDTTDAE